MNARFRQALVQAAHLIADALEETDAEKPGLAKVKRLPKKPARQRTPRVYVPPRVEMSEVDRERARQACKRAGIPVA